MKARSWCRASVIVLGSVMCLGVVASCSDDDASVTTVEPSPPTAPSSTTDQSTTIPATTSPPTTPSTTVTPSTTATTSIPTTTVPTTPTSTTQSVSTLAYFLRNELVSPVRRNVAGETDELRAGLLALLEGPTDTERDAGLASTIPAGTELRSVRLSDGRVTVDLSAEFAEGGGSLSVLTRVAQVVATATQDPDVMDVQLLVEGQITSEFSGEGLDISQPMDRNDIDGSMPFILLDEPAPLDEVTSPVPVRGWSNAFEATFQFQVVAADGQLIYDSFFTGGGAWGEWLPFETTIDLAKYRGPALLRAFEFSPRDGSIEHLVEVPVVVVG